MPQVCSVQADCFAVREAAHILPVHFSVAETWPSVCLGFLYEVIHGPSLGCSEEEFACDGIVEGNGFIGMLFLQREGVVITEAGNSVGLIWQ